MPTWKPNVEKYSFELKKRVITLYCRNKSRDYISKEVGYSKPVIHAIINHYSNSRNEHWNTTESLERKIVYIYTRTRIGCSKISKYYGLTEQKVIAILKRNNVEIRKFTEYRRYVLNESYFSVIDSEHKAYWLGFLLADGCNSRDRSIKFSLNVKDKYILERFKDDIGSNAPIVEDEIMATITIHSKAMLKDLSKYGFVKNKTFSITLPIINEELYSHFIRGYFDGDGSFSFGLHKSRQSHILSGIFSLAGTENLLLSIQNILINNCNVNETKLIDRKSIKVMSYGGADQIHRIYQYLYKDATIYLDRKKEKFLDFLIQKGKIADGRV